MSLIRVARTSRVTLTHTFTVDEQPTDASGNVTVTLTRLDGTPASSGGGIATHPGPAGAYTFLLDPSAVVDTWIVDWSGSIAGATVTARDVVEIVGGFYFGLDEVRNAHTVLASTANYPSSFLAQKRTQVEQECDRITSRAFVPRFTRLVVDGTGCDELTVPDLELRTVRAASIAWTSDGQFVALTAGELAYVTASRSGIITRRGGIWPYGAQNVIVEYEYGAEYPPEDIRAANILRMRSVVTSTNSGIPDRALSFTIADGGIYRLSMPGPNATGVPEVDAAYSGNAYAVGFA